MMSGKLQKEIKKRLRFSNLELEVFLNLQKTAGMLMDEVSELFKPHSISPTQYNVLRILRGAGAGCGSEGQAQSEAKGLSCREIGERMITRDPDMTRLLDRLEERGLITRAREKADRRMIRSCISEQGLEVLKELDEPLLELHKKQLGHLGREKLGELLDLLESVRERSSEG